MKQTMTLIILDGLGIGEDYYGNAVSLANMNNFDLLMKNHSNTLLEASGEAVGLPEGQIGNSEVGHLNIGAGRVVYQDLKKISNEIKSGEFFNKKEFDDVINYVNKENKSLHIFGLLSDGGVHSHISHLFALLDLCREKNVERVYIHAFTDGRDVSPKSGIKYVSALEDKLEELGIGQIATIGGRYYAMDRDNRWDRLEKAYRTMTEGTGERFVSAEYALQSSYADDITDEFIEPCVIEDDLGEIHTVGEGDGVIFMNYRPDRAREITRAFVDDDFSHFTREKLNVKFVCMTVYDATIKNVEVVYRKEKLINTLGEYLGNLGLNQLRVAETEKYAHVTFFFNGGVEASNKGEDRILIPSPKVATYDLKPEMSAIKVKDEVLKNLESGKYDFIIVNFANPDMVGHTGDISATVDALELVDRCLGEILNKIIKFNGKAIVTADHGNCERMIDPSDDTPFTAHTTNKVPFIVLDGDNRYKLETDGALCDIAPTMLDLMGIEKPVEMTGKSLIIR